MGHFYTEIRGEGKDRKEALANALDDFFYEEGHRHNLREVTKSEFIERVPPTGVRTVKGGVVHFDGTRRNENAPAEEWLEVWKFEIHTHA